jgi:hypothetical protein
MKVFYHRVILIKKKFKKKLSSWFPQNMTLTLSTYCCNKRYISISSLERTKRYYCWLSIWHDNSIHLSFSLYVWTRLSSWLHWTKDASCMHMQIRIHCKIHFINTLLQYAVWSWRFYYCIGKINDCSLIWNVSDIKSCIWDTNYIEELFSLIFEYAQNNTISVMTWFPWKDHIGANNKLKFRANTFTVSFNIPSLSE